MVEKFCRPSILFSIEEDGMARGSGRSAGGLHLLDALTDCKDLLITFGGHAAAAGMTIKTENIVAFRKRFNEAVRARLGSEEPSPLIKADTEVSLGELTPKVLRIINRMEPFGPGNMRPVLVAHHVKNRAAPRVVGNRHLKMTVIESGVVMDAIAFDFGDRIGDVKRAADFSLAFSLDENEWNGTVSLQMRVKGVVA
jgi:single-stranded-DNA-specific exonuclease